MLLNSLRRSSKSVRYLAIHVAMFGSLGIPQERGLSMTLKAILEKPEGLPPSPAFAHIWDLECPKEILESCPVPMPHK